MSDFDQPSYVPPLPPAPTAPPPPPPAPFGAPAAPPYGVYPAGVYPPMYAQAPPKPARPDVKVGSLLLIVGAVGLVVGSVLTWVTIGADTFNGFSEESISLDGEDNGGRALVFLAVVLAGFGIAQLAARRVLAVAILAVVFASFALLAVLAEMGNVSDAIEFTELFGSEASWGPGVPVLGVSAMVALGGAITTLARRRK